MSNIQQLLETKEWEKRQNAAQKLVHKWKQSGLLENLKNNVEINNMAVLLENQAKQVIAEGNISGGTNSMSGGQYNSENWAGVVLPLVRRIFADISAKDFLSVQPMTLPSGLVFYLDFKYGTNKSPFQLGESLYGANPNTNVTETNKGLYGAGRFGYSINNATASVTVTTGSLTMDDLNQDSAYSASLGDLQKLVVSGVNYNNVSGSFDLEAVRAFTITSGSVSAVNILQQFTKINGNTLEFVVYNANAEGGSYTLTYSKATRPDARGDFEDAFGNPTASQLSQSQPIKIPEINVQLKSESITAKTRKLKAQWTPEFAQDLNAYHSIDAEAELTGILSQYISMEIDLELLDMLIEQAHTKDYWSARNNEKWNGTGFSQTSAVVGDGYYNTQGGWFQTLGTTLQKVSNKIHQLTLRGGANFLVLSPTVATIIESIPGFASDGDGEKSEFNFGIQKIGSLNSRYKVYKNPYMTENVILMGYRGSQFLECGAVFAPYVPLIMTPLIYDPETFTPRKGLMTRYAKKVIRPDYYGKVYVSGLETV